MRTSPTERTNDQPKGLRREQLVFIEAVVAAETIDLSLEPTLRDHFQDPCGGKPEGKPSVRPNMDVNVKPTECRNFETCNASVCPLDPARGVHLVGDRVCVYALASGKTGAIERYQNFPEFLEVGRRLPELVIRFPAIRRAVERAAKQPFRPDQSKNLHPIKSTKA